MRRVDRVVQGAIEHADLTFDKLVEALRPPREASRMPLFQVNFRILRAPAPALEIPGLAITPPKFVDTGTAKFDLALELEAATGQDGFFEYSTELFDQATIAEMARDFEAVLMAVMEEPDRPLSQLEALRRISQRVRARKVNW
jgi:non-ribosomal peptide synthetase component F